MTDTLSPSDDTEDSEGTEGTDNAEITDNAEDTENTESDTRTPRSGWWAALAGLLAAGAALATGEVMSGISPDIPSLVIGIAEVFTDETPGGIVRWSIDNIGASQKTLLVWGISYSTLIVGAILGVLALKRRWIAWSGFAVFGVLGGWAGARAALSSNGWTWFSALLSAAIGLAVLLALLDLLPFKRRAGGPGGLVGTPERRKFLGIAGGAAFWAIFGTGLGRSLRANHSVEGARDQVAADLAATARATGPGTAAVAEPAAAVLADGTLDATPGISSLVTPNEDFYLIDTAIRKPQVDPATWSMTIKGMVDNELTFTFDDLLAMDRIEEMITLSCVSNQVGGTLVGNAVWTGVPLATLLDMAGVQEGAEQLVSRSVDDWACGFPIEVALDGRPALVAVTMNGEPLPIEHGFPARLVVPGLYGYVSATKWLSEIELTTWEGFDGYWIPRGWAKEGPIKTQSRIDVPRHGTTIKPGPTAIAGVAWAPHRSIEMVEVRVDGGEWMVAELSDELTENSWRQWLVEYDAAVGEHTIEVRATDGDGVTQIEERTNVAPDGASGWHTVLFRTEV